MCRSTAIRRAPRTGLVLSSFDTPHFGIQRSEMLTENPHNSPESSRLCSDASGTSERSREIEHVEMPRIPGFWGIAYHA